MVNFWARETVPDRFGDRNLYRHNANVTLMRTTAEECRGIGREMASRLSRATGPTAVLLPRQGVSGIDRAGQPFNDPVAREALFAELRGRCGTAELIELDAHINDAEFAEAAANKLIELMGRG
jgi:uncharacterized protein (UPF0261 family)